MKPRLLSAARVSLPLATAIVALLSAQSANAAIWTSGAGNGNWGNGANWGGSVPAANSLIQFNNTSGTQTNIYISNNRTVSGIQFLSGNSAAQNIELSTQPNATGTAVNLTFNSTNTGISVADGRNHTIGNPFGAGADGDVVLAGNLAIATTSGNLTINRPVTGNTFSVTKSGTGLLALSGANTFTGGLIIKAGTVTVSSSSSALGGTGTGAVTLGDTTGTATASLLVGTTGLTYANPITLATNASVGTLTIGNSADIAATTFSGGVTGNNALTINNSSSTAAARTVTFQTSDMAINGRITNIGTSTGTTTISSKITSANTVGVTQSSSGSLTFSGVGNAYSGTTIIAAGRLNANSASALGTSTVNMTGASTILSFGTGIGSVATFSNPINVTNTATGTSLIVATSSKVSLNAAINISADTTIQGTGTDNQIGTTSLGTITSANNSNLTIAVSNSQNHVFDGAISLGIGSVTRSAASTSNLSLTNASNDFSGGLFIGSVGNGLGGIQSGATTITNNGAQGSGDITFISGNTAPITFSNVSGTVANNIVTSGGTGGLIKSGGSTMTLTGANTYTGTTNITGGTLALSGSGSIAASPTIIVGATTTFDVSAVSGGYTLAAAQTLTGTGTVAGAMTVAGTLSPGNSPGILPTAGQTWVNGGDYNWQVLDAVGAAGTGFDQVQITGTLDLTSLTTGGFNINLWSLSSIGPDVSGNASNFDHTIDQSWIILTTSAGITGFDAANFAISVGANNGTGGFSNSLGGGGFTLGTDLNSNNLILSYTPVPEPDIAALLGGLGALMLLRRRR